MMGYRGSKVVQKFKPGPDAWHAVMAPTKYPASTAYYLGAFKLNIGGVIHFKTEKWFRLRQESMIQKCVSTPVIEAAS